MLEAESLYHFLSILAGVDAAFPPYLWDLLLPQAELTINLLRQATANPKISAWEYFNGPFDFNKTPLAPMGCRVLIHAKPSTRRSWDYRAKHGFYVGPALDHYRCYELVKSDTKQKVISDTVQFRHAYLQIPAVSAEDKILNGLQVMVGLPPITCIATTRISANPLLVVLCRCPPPSLHLCLSQMSMSLCPHPPILLHSSQTSMCLYTRHPLRSPSCPHLRRN